MKAIVFRNKIDKSDDVQFGPADGLARPPRLLVAGVEAKNPIYEPRLWLALQPGAQTHLSVAIIRVP